MDNGQSESIKARACVCHVVVCSMAYKKMFRKYFKRKMSRGKRTRSQKMLRRTISKVLMKKTETKHAGNGAEAWSLYHNGSGSGSGAAAQPIGIPGLDNLWRYCTTGTTVTNRIGNEIYPRGISLRLYLENMDDRPNLHYRIICGFRPKTNADGTVTTATTMAQMLDASANGNLIRHTSSDQGYKFVYDRVVRSEIGFSSAGMASSGQWFPNQKRSHIFKKIWLRPKKGSKIIYPSGAFGAVIDPINKAFFTAIIAYDSNNTLTTDKLAELNYTYKIYWKDV